MFETNGTILTLIHWKISINLFINSQKHFTVYNTFVEKISLWVPNINFKTAKSYAKSIYILTSLYSEIIYVEQNF